MQYGHPTHSADIKIWWWLYDAVGMRFAKGILSWLKLTGGGMEVNTSQRKSVQKKK